MALDSLTSQAILSHGKGPTLLQQFQARQAEAEKAELDKQVTLSNLATQGVQRQGLMQEQEQSQYNFDMKRQRIDAIRQIVQKAMSESDPETRFNAIRDMQATLAEYGADAQEMYAFQGFVKSMSPKEDYGYQQEEAGLNLEGVKADIQYKDRAGRAALMNAQARATADSTPAWKRPALLNEGEYRKYVEPYFGKDGLDLARDKKVRDKATAAMRNAQKILTDEGRAGGYEMPAEQADAVIRAAAKAATEDYASLRPWETFKKDFNVDRFNELVGDENFIRQVLNSSIESTESVGGQTDQNAQVLQQLLEEVRSTGTPEEVAEAEELVRRAMEK